jgi:hypothetical protein
MEHSEYEPRLGERKHLMPSNKDYRRVKKLKIKPYNEKVPHPESLDRLNTTRLDLRRANKLNYSGIKIFSVLGGLCSRNGDDKLSRGVNL